MERNNQQLPLPYRLFIGLVGSMGTLLYKIMRMRYYGVNWARNVIEHSDAQAICFDHIMPGHYVVGAFLRAAKTLSIPTLTLPHGVHLYTNEATKPKATSTRRMLKFNSFDYVIAPNELRKKMLTQSGVSADKIFVLGSARYCDEWMEQNKKILPKRFGNRKNKINKLRLAFLPSKPQCNVDQERMTKTLEFLADIDDIEVMIKPHTRTSENIDFSIGKNLRNASDVLTADLCEWADAVLVVGSSVITEALMKKKPALYLKYLHSNTTLFEELHACWTIGNESELNAAVLSLCENKTAIPYGRKNVKNYLMEVVYGGTEEKDVLAKYKNIIVDYAAKTMIPRS
jgi:UDP-N-acetylglucosamine 2-epimerase